MAAISYYVVGLFGHACGTVSQVAVSIDSDLADGFGCPNRRQLDGPSSCTAALGRRPTPVESSLPGDVCRPNPL